MTKSKVLFKNVASLGGVQIVNYIFPLLTIPYVSRILGPSGLGIINYVTAFIAYFTLIVAYAFDMSSTRDISKSPHDFEKINEVFCRTSNARLMLFSISTILFIFFTFFIEKFADNKLLSFIVYINVVTVLIATQYIYQGIQKISFFSILNVCKGILVTASVFLLVNHSGDYLIYAFITSFFSLSVNLFLLLYAYKKFNLRFKFYPLKDSLKSLKADKHLFFSSVVFNLYTSTNIIILGFYESTTVVGYYTVALGLIGIIQSVVNIPMSVALFPFVGSSFAESIDNGIEQLRRIFPLVFYVAFFGGIVLFFIAPFLVHLIYGKAFEASVISIKILCFLPLLSCLSSLFGTLTMINLKMDKEFFVITFIASVVSLCSNFIFVSFFSYIGTTISYLITEIVVIFGLYYSLKKRGVNLIKLEYFRLAEIVNLVKKIR